MGVAGLSTLGSADDDSDIPWDRFHSILADRYNEREADVAVEITEPFAETGVPGLTPPEHEAVMERLYLDDRTPELTADIEEFRHRLDNDKVQAPRPQVSSEFSILGDVLNIACDETESVPWEDGEASDFSLAAALAYGSASAGRVAAMTDIVLFGAAEIEAWTWADFHPWEDGTYYAEIPYTVDALDLSAGSEATLEVKAYPNANTDREGIKITGDRWEGPVEREDLTDPSGQFQETVPLEANIDYRIQATLTATFTGDATCTADIEPVNNPCRQEIAIGFDDIDMTHLC